MATELEINEKIAAAAEVTRDAKKEVKNRQDVVKLLVNDARRLTKEKPDNLELLLLANSSAQEAAKAHAKDGQEALKAASGAEKVLWEELNKLHRAEQEAEEKKQMNARANQIEDDYAPAWTSEIDSFNTVLIIQASTGSRGLSIAVADPEEDYDSQLNLSQAEEDSLREFLNTRHAAK